MTIRKKRSILNGMIIILTVLAWCIMAARNRVGGFWESGLANIRYFTVMSNVFRGGISVAILVSFKRNTGMEEGKKLAVWNYVATSAVGLTFLVVFAFFAPLAGLASVLGPANFFFHLVIPVLAMADYILYNAWPIRMPVKLAAMIPPLLYGMSYLLNLLINGVGGRAHSNDWYGFATWGLPIGLCIFAAICGCALLVGFLLSLANKRVLERRE